MPNASLSIEQRLDRLERSLRRWRQAAISLALLGLTLGGLGAAAIREVPLNLRARQFTVLDENNNEVAVLFADKQGGKLGLLTPDGNVAATMGSEASGGFLGLHTRDGRLATAVANDAQGRAVFSMANPDGADVIQMVALEQGGAVVISNAAEAKAVVINADETQGHVVTYDRKGDEIGRVR